MSRTLRVGTRASLLARTQTDLVVKALTVEAGIANIEIIPIVTEGDTTMAAIE